MTNCKTAEVPREDMLILTETIIDYLNKRGLWEGEIVLYSNDKAYMPYLPKIANTTITKEKTTEGTTYFHINRSVKNVTNYCNPDTVTMTFEGELYDLINRNLDSTLQDLDRIGKEYGLFTEQGDAWSLAFYPID